MFLSHSCTQCDGRNMQLTRLYTQKFSNFPWSLIVVNYRVSMVGAECLLYGLVVFALRLKVSKPEWCKANCVIWHWH